MKNSKLNRNKALSYLVTLRDETPVSVTMTVENKPYTVPASHDNFKAVLAELTKPAPDTKKLRRLMDLHEAVLEYLDRDFSIRNGKLFYKGAQLGGVVVTRVVDFIKRKIPFQTTLAFIKRLPDDQLRRDAVFKFLETEGLTLTPDGCIMAYKGVKANFCSTMYQNNFRDLQNAVLIDNYIRFKPGDKPRAPLSECDRDPNVHCGRGIHVGSHSYAKSYADGAGGHMILCKIQPEDVASVPYDSREKMRVCSLEVISDLSSQGQGKYGQQLTGTYTNLKKLKRKVAVMQKRAGKKKRAEKRRNKLARRGKTKFIGKK
jgi:hypothetical protein